MSHAASCSGESDDLVITDWAAKKCITRTEISFDPLTQIVAFRAAPSAAKKDTCFPKFKI